MEKTTGIVAIVALPAAVGAVTAWHVARELQIDRVEFLPDEDDEVEPLAQPKQPRG